MKTKITVCKSAGFCFGVGRAVDMALRDGRKLYSLGPLVHNRRVLDTLRQGGVRDVETLEEIPDDAVVLIRSHGASRALTGQLAGRTVLDGTCPCVARIHEIVRRESKQGRGILIFGNPEHPEVMATASWCDRVHIFENLPDLERLTEEHPEWKNMPLTAVAQTTALSSEWEESSKFFKKVYTNVKILDTICQATNMRQREAAALSESVDLMLVLGDRKSSNTRHLAQVCRKAVLLQTAQELDLAALPIGGHIGVTAGASTPASIIEEVVETMTEELKKAEAAGVTEISNGDGESFAELLESSLKTLMNGDKVTGIITGITPTEIQVDLGTKHAGYIPADELTDDPSENAAAKLNIGDEIETFVVRVNDVEGTAMLSRKRLEAVKSWEVVEAAQDNGMIVDGIVTEENKGGVVVSVKGVRVFVPASQTGLPKETPMSTLLKRKVRLRITEFNRQRRRVVGSIRSATQDERRAASEAIWSSIEEGKVYQGTVKSLTSYGAFVDIGGIDGMVHVSELSWSRIHQPGDVVKIGDSIEVYVLSFDREKKKISLGHRKAEDNPWSKFTTQFNIGDVFEARVVKLMTFGAFCEVIPGVDGLVHISQLADRRVDKPGDVVSEGDIVTVKLLDVDYDRKKISLSIRALLEQPPVQQEGGESPDEVVASVGEASGTAIASDLIENGELDNIAEAMAEAVVEVVREETAE